MSRFDRRSLFFVQVCALAVAAVCWIACGDSDSGDTTNPSPSPTPGFDGAPGSDARTDVDGAMGTDSGTTADGSDGATAPVIVYSNDFETNTTGFDVTPTETLPSDADGGVSKYLGQRSPISTNAVLTLVGLTPGATYRLAFDLYVGGTWDGSGTFGPDPFTVTSSSSGVLVNATFRNGFPKDDPTPSQSYSDGTPLDDGGLFPTRAGADVKNDEAIYYFGHGAGNPVLSFKAQAATETITFHSVDAQGVGDEFFALDNVVVTKAP
jgi:hypothetical protein